MGNRLRRGLVPVVGLAVFTLPVAVLAPAVLPGSTACAGGICNVCPTVADVLSTAGAQIYCIA